MFPIFLAPQRCLIAGLELVPQILESIARLILLLVPHDNGRVEGFHKPGLVDLWDVAVILGFPWLDSQGCHSALVRNQWDEDDEIGEMVSLFAPALSSMQISRDVALGN